MISDMCNGEREARVRSYTEVTGEWPCIVIDDFHKGNGNWKVSHAPVDNATMCVWAALTEFGALFNKKGLEGRIMYRNRRD